MARQTQVRLGQPQRKHRQAQSALGHSRLENLFDVSGSVVFVSGAASGLGLGIAEVMAAKRARVVKPGRDVDTKRQSAGELQAGRASVEAVQLDVADLEGVHRDIRQISE